MHKLPEPEIIIAIMLNVHIQILNGDRRYNKIYAGDLKM